MNNDNKIIIYFRVTTSLLLELQNKHPDWRNNNNIAMTYDGKSSLFTSELSLLYIITKFVNYNLFLF